MDIVFSNWFSYIERSLLLLLRLEYKYQYLLALSLKLYTDRLHSFYNLLTLLVHQTKEKTQKREKDINPAPLTLDTLQSKTEEFDPSFFPKSTDSYCYVVVFFIYFWHRIWRSSSDRKTNFWSGQQTAALLFNSSPPSLSSSLECEPAVGNQLPESSWIDCNWDVNRSIWHQTW